MAKPSLPQGTRDFGPEVVRKRNYIFNTIKNVFELYGYQPLETPAMENIETLMGKYGEEGDKLIFRILDSGDPLKKEFYEELFLGLRKYIKDESEYLSQQLKKHNIEKSPESILAETTNPLVFAFYIEQILNNESFSKYYLPKFKARISGKALKYDLTIPFARYVAMNHGQLTFPFKRYQIQPVWRADRPQKGRYREFYQCDADVVGSTSLLNEVEFINIYAQVFEQLKIPFEIKINNRKILTALAKLSSGIDKMTEITTAIDKLDKIGLGKVKEELIQRGLSINEVLIVEKYLTFSGSNEEKISAAKDLLGSIEEGNKGIEELQTILKYPIASQYSSIHIDFTLARGLNYYTGTIFEVKAKNVQMGSIGGGGRYDDLTGLFGVSNIPGVGISFGVDRIYDVMEELKLFPTDVYTGTQVLFFNLGEKESKVAFELAQQLRQ